MRESVAEYYGQVLRSWHEKISRACTKASAPGSKNGSVTDEAAHTSEIHPPVPSAGSCCRAKGVR